MKTYLLGIVAAAMLMSILSSIPLGSHIKNQIRLIGTLLIILCLLSPMIKIHPERVSQMISAMIMETEEVRTGVALKSREVQAAIIKQQCIAYILDKAQELGIDIAIELELKIDGEYPYPFSIVLTGTATNNQKEILSDYLSKEFGIPVERQVWKVPNE